MVPNSLITVYNSSSVENGCIEKKNPIMILYIYYNNTAQNNFGIFSRKLFWNIKQYKSNIYLNIKTFRIRLLFYTHRYIYSTFLRSPKVTFYPLLPPPGFVPLAPYFTVAWLVFFRRNFLFNYLDKRLDDSDNSN